MKFITLLAAGAMAASPLVKRDSYDTIVADFARIENQTEMLNTVLVNYAGPNDLTKLLDAVTVTIGIVQNATKDAQASPMFSPKDAANLVPSVVHLATAVKTSIKSAIAKKCVFIGEGLGSAFLQNLVSLQNSSNTFSNSVLVLIPEFFQETAHDLSDPIIDSLQQGVDAFNTTETAANCTNVTSGAGSRMNIALGSVTVAALFAAAL